MVCDYSRGQNRPHIKTVTDEINGSSDCACMPGILNICNGMAAGVTRGGSQGGTVVYRQR